MISFQGGNGPKCMQNHSNIATIMQCVFTTADRKHITKSPIRSVLQRGFNGDGTVVGWNSIRPKSMQIRNECVFPASA